MEKFRDRGNPGKLIGVVGAGLTTGWRRSTSTAVSSTLVS